MGKDRIVIHPFFLYTEPNKIVRMVIPFPSWGLYAKVIEWLEKEGFSLSDHVSAPDIVQRFCPSADTYPNRATRPGRLDEV